MSNADPMDRLRARVAALDPAQQADFRRQLEARGIAWDSLAPQAEAVSRPDRLPLSPGQMHFWIQQSLYPESSAYHVAYRWRLRGPLDRAALEKSLQAIVDRHAPLRTAFPLHEGEPWQQVLPGCAFALDFTDAEGSEARLEEAARRAATAPFDLTQAPLFRVHLVRFGAQEHLLAITLHHMIADGWSRGVLMRELAAGYRAFCAGRAPELPDLSGDFAACVRAQQDWLQGSASHRQRAHWKARLSDLKPLELPTDRSRHSTIDMAAARITRDLPSALYAQVGVLAARLGTTTFTVLAATFKLLLHRYCGQRDLVICTPVAGRMGAEAASLIGLFTNTLVLRTRLDPGLTFSQWVGQVQDCVSDALDHQELPFPMVAEALGLNRDARQNPLSQVMFQVQTGGYQQQNAEEVDLGVAGLSVRQQPAPLRETKVDLSWYMMERESGCLLTIEYRTALFDPWRVARMATHFEQLLQSVLQAPHALLPTLNYMSEEERHALVALGTAVEAPLPRVTVHEVIADVARRYPEGVALESDGRSWSYRQLEDDAHRLARWLSSGPEPVQPGDRVAVSLPGKGASIVALLALLKAGAIYVPLDPDHPADRVAYVLQDAGVSLILTDQPQLYPAHRCLDPLAPLPEADPAVALPAADPARLAYLLYTSGSTGRPNGVPIGHISLLNHLRSMAQRPGLRPGDRMLAITTPTFDISILEMLLPLSVGATVVLYGQGLLLAPAKLAEVLSRDRITHMQATPAYWRMLLDSGWRGCATLTALCGGEALDAPLARRLLQHVGTLWNVYGPTEATIWASALVVTPEHAESGKVPIGGAVDNTHLHVLDAYLEPLPRGIPGELHIGGACLSPGYWNRPSLAAARFVPNPFRAAPGQPLHLYRTGDAVVRLAGDEIEFIGRTDFQVKLRGYRIEIGEIEDCLLKEPLVEQAIVMLDAPNERLVAYALVRDPAAVIDDGSTERALRQSLAAQLPRYMVPTAFVLMRDFPLNPNGKVDRKQLPLPKASVARTLPTAPRNAAEATLLAIWTAVLQRDDFGVEDNFFDLGGDSILGVRIVARAQAQGLELEPTQIFEHQTVAAQAAVADRKPSQRPQLSRWQCYATGADLAPWLVTFRAPAPDAVMRRAAELVTHHHPALRGHLVPDAVHAALDCAGDDDPGLAPWARDVSRQGGRMTFGLRTYLRDGAPICALAAHPLLVDAPAIGWMVADFEEAAGALIAGAAPVLHAPGSGEAWLAQAGAETPVSAPPLSDAALVGEVCTALGPDAVAHLRTTARHLDVPLELMVLKALEQALAPASGGDAPALALLTASRPDAACRRMVGNFTRLVPISAVPRPLAHGPDWFVAQKARLAAPGPGGDPSDAGTARIVLAWQDREADARAPGDGGASGGLHWQLAPRCVFPQGCVLGVEALAHGGGLDLRWHFDPARQPRAEVEARARLHLQALTGMKAEASSSAAKVDRLLDRLRSRKD